MASGHDSEFLQAAAIYLGAAVVAVPLFKRLKLGSVIGYLTAGVLIGPSIQRQLGPDGLGLLSAEAMSVFPDAASALQVAEFGVVLLLFVIGLELKLERLWRLRIEVFGLGFAQVVLTGLVIGLVAWATGLWGLGLSWREAVVAGAGLALSSTAFAVQILREKGDLASPYGDRSFAILLFQDLAIVPLIALVSFLAPVSEINGDPVWYQAMKAMAAVGAVYFVGRYGLRPLFHVIAQTKADEVFTAAALLIVVAAALVMNAAGLSMAMGAFLAGVLLAESEFRHQLETDIEPFRGLLMGLFFISVGMSLDLEALVQFAGWILLGLIVLLALKIAILYALSRGMGSSLRDAVRIAAVLCQGGEFGFVLFSEALSSGVMGVANASLLNATVILSMAATPLMVLLADRFAERRQAAAAEKDGGSMRRVEDASEEELSAPIIVAGFGRSGQVVARILRLRGYEVTLIDNNPDRIRLAQTFGAHVFFGDTRRLDTLATAGAERARAIFLCINDRDGARLAVERIRNRFPNTMIFASTYDRFTQLEMERAGAHAAVREKFESSIVLAREGLAQLGDGEACDDLIEEFRRRDAQLLRLQAEFGAKEGLKKLREEFSLEKER